MNTKLERVYTTLLLICCTLCSIVLWKTEAHATTLSEVDYTWLNLREAPTTESPVKAVLHKGDAMLLYKKVGNWCYIGTNVEGKTKKGWCAASGVNGSGEIVQYITRYTPKTFGYIKPKSTKLYSKPSTKSKAKTTLKKGDKVTVKDWSGLFVKVSVRKNGKIYSGYICPIYLDQVKTINGIDLKCDCLKIGYVNYKYLNLREKATTASRCIEVLSCNDVLKIHSTPKGWYGVTAYHNGRWISGFVSRNYVTILS